MDTYVFRVFLCYWNITWRVLHAPTDPNNVSIMETKISSFLDQFVFCVQSCNWDLMSFSEIVGGGGHTIIFLAPASWQAGPKGRSCAYQLSTHCHNDRMLARAGKRRVGCGLQDCALMQQLMIPCIMWYQQDVKARCHQSCAAHASQAQGWPQRQTTSSPVELQHCHLASFSSVASENNCGVTSCLRRRWLFLLRWKHCVLSIILNIY